MPSRSDTSITLLVIPIFRNEETIQPLCQAIEKLESDLNMMSARLIVNFVIDGSPDRSKEILLTEKANKKKSNWNVISLSRNFGQTNAILAGLSSGQADNYVCMSADLQDPVSLIPEMIKQYRLGSKIVIAARSSREDSLPARITSRIAYFILRREIDGIPKGGFDFFLLDARAKNQILNMKGMKRFIQGDIVSIGFPVSVIPYHRSRRAGGVSAYSFKARLGIFVDFMIDISQKPLRVVTFVGISLSILGFIAAFLALISYFRGDIVFRGFTPIYLGILIFGGIQLISIGILGEYVMRIYDMSRERPAWIIEEIV